MKLNTLKNLLIDQLKDLKNAETQLTEALPKMAKASTSPKLRQAFENHLQETETHITRLEQILEELHGSSQGKKCKAMEGLIKEGAEMIETEAEADVKDAGLIASAQKAEHYEIASYGTARTYARLLGHEEIAQLLQKTLDEEYQADKYLTHLAEVINIEAMDGGSESSKK